MSFRFVLLSSVSIISSSSLLLATDRVETPTSELRCQGNVKRQMSFSEHLNLLNSWESQTICRLLENKDDKSKSKIQSILMPILQAEQSACQSLALSYAPEFLKELEKHLTVEELSAAMDLTLQVTSKLCSSDKLGDLYNFFSFHYIMTKEKSSDWTRFIYTLIEDLYGHNIYNFENKKEDLESILRKVTGQELMTLSKLTSKLENEVCSTCDHLGNLKSIVDAKSELGSLDKVLELYQLCKGLVCKSKDKSLSIIDDMSRIDADKRTVIMERVEKFIGHQNLHSVFYEVSDLSSEVFEAKFQIANQFSHLNSDKENIFLIFEQLDGETKIAEKYAPTAKRMLELADKHQFTLAQCAGNFYTLKGIKEDIPPQAFALKDIFEFADFAKALIKLNEDERNLVVRRLQQVLGDKQIKWVALLSRSNENPLKKIAEISDEKWPTIVGKMREILDIYVVNKKSNSPYLWFKSDFLNAVSILDKAAPEHLDETSEILKFFANYQVAENSDNEIDFSGAALAEDIKGLRELKKIATILINQKGKKYTGSFFSRYNELDGCKNAAHLVMTHLHSLDNFNDPYYFFVNISSKADFSDQEQKILEPLLKHFQKNFTQITYHFQEMSLEELNVAVGFCEKFMGGQSDGMIASSLLENLLAVPSEEREYYSKILSNVFNFCKYPDSRYGVLQLFMETDRKLHEALAETVITFFSDLQYGHDAILELLVEIPQEDWKWLCERGLKNVQDKDGYLIADHMQMIYDLHWDHDAAASKDVIAKAMDFFNLVKFGGLISLGSNLQENLMLPYGVTEKHSIRAYYQALLGVLNLDDQIATLAYLSSLEVKNSEQANRLGENFGHLVGHLLDSQIIDRSLLFDYWKKIMQTSHHLPQAKKIADFVVTFYTFMNLELKSDLVQQAIRTGINIESSDKLLSPYNIFKRLQEKRQVAVDWAAINPVEETVEGVCVSFNPLFIKDHLSEYTVTTGALPTWSPNTFKDLTREIIKKVESNDQLKNQILQATGFNSATLIEDNEQDKFLQHHLSFDRKQDGDVPLTTARLIAICSYIESLSSDPIEGEGFTEQESTFIKIMASIQGCINGLEEGGHSYYLNILPPQFRYGHSKSLDSKELTLSYENSKSEICQILREEIEKQFSGQNQLMKSLVGIKTTDEVMQASHQATYFRKLIGLVFGLPDKVQFDARTQLLYVKLVAITKQEALQHLFKFFPPHDFIYRVATKYNMGVAETVDQMNEMGILKLHK